jgi:hypothetical protein
VRITGGDDEVLSIGDIDPADDLRGEARGCLRSCSYAMVRNPSGDLGVTSLTIWRLGSSGELARDPEILVFRPRHQGSSDYSGARPPQVSGQAC